MHLLLSSVLLNLRLINDIIIQLIIQYDLFMKFFRLFCVYFFYQLVEFPTFSGYNNNVKDKLYFRLIAHCINFL